MAENRKISGKIFAPPLRENPLPKSFGGVFVGQCVAGAREMRAR
jgi:hypothetical protein